MHPTAGRTSSVLWALLALDVSLAFVVAPIRTCIMTSTTSINAVSTEGEVKQYPSLPKIVKGILFDMDGTLTDSDTLHFEAYQETFLKVTVTLGRAAVEVYMVDYRGPFLCLNTITGSQQDILWH